MGLTIWQLSCEQRTEGVDSILVTAGHTAERWVTRGIALGGQSSVPSSEHDKMVDMLYKVIAFVTLLHGLTPKLGVWVMNVRGRQALLPPSAPII